MSEMGENVHWVGFVVVFLEQNVLVVDLKSSTLKGMFSNAFWQACSVLLAASPVELIFRNEISFAFQLRKPHNSVLPPPLPPFRVNDFDIPSGFILKTLRWQRLLWDDMYHPLEALPLSLGSEGRHLDSFKWGQQTSRLPARGRFDTAEIGTVCGEKWKHNQAMPALNSDFQSQLRMHLAAHCKVQTCHAHMTSLNFHLSHLKCWVLLKTSVLAKCTVVSGGKMPWKPVPTLAWER